MIFLVTKNKYLKKQGKINGLIMSMSGLVIANLVGNLLVSWILT